MSLSLLNRISLSFLYVLFFLSLHGQDAMAEKLSPELAFELKEGSPNQKYKIIVILKDQVDVKKLEEQELRSMPTRDLQVKLLLDALQVKAERSQEKLIADISGSPN